MVVKRVGGVPFLLGRGTDRIKVNSQLRRSFCSGNAKLSDLAPILALKPYSQRHCVYNNFPKFKSF